MTNYNERLDEVLGRIISQDSSREGGWAEFFTDTKEYLESVPYGNPLENQQELKQAITSLIKELVAEAKPKITFSKPEGMPNTLAVDFAQRHLDEFEQNLLKALEEL